MYDQSHRAIKLRTYTGVSLAWWHSYKWATTKIMQVFGKDIIAPMFHHLFPNKEYAVAKMKLPAMATYLTFIRLAYPSFKQQLDTAAARADLTARQQAVLGNMTDLVEFFIPVVMFCSFIYQDISFDILLVLMLSCCCCWGFHGLLFFSLRKKKKKKKRLMFFFWCTSCSVGFL